LLAIDGRRSENHRNVKKPVFSVFTWSMLVFTFELIYFDNF